MLYGPFFGAAQRLKKDPDVTIYAVFERDAKEGPAVVADRFSWFAAILPPIYAIAYGLWLELAAFVVFVLLLAVVGKIASAEAALWTYVVIAVWLGYVIGSMLNAGKGN